MPRALAQLAARLKQDAQSPDAEATDRDLLTRFLREQNEAAFETLVVRHSRLVSSAIAKVLTDPHDAEDAFQATFLILVRRARSIDWRTGVGPWLYGVAHRVAVKVRDTSLTRARREKGARVAQSTSEAPPDLSWREACALLHAELDQLPDRYRLPLLLCHLEGKTRDEAAAALKVTVGTVKGRLERGRELLRARLARRGVALSVTLLATVAADGARALSPSISATLSTARGGASDRVLTLTREFAMSSVLSQLTKSVAGALIFGAVASVLFAAGAGGPTRATDEKRPSPAPQQGAVTSADGTQGGAKPGAFIVNVKVQMPDGKPAANARVSVWAERKEQVTGRTDKTGQIDLTIPTHLPKVVVVATAEGFAPDWAEIAPAVPGRPVQSTVLTLLEDSITLDGRVTDLEGRAVANLPVEVERIGRPKPGKTIDEHVRDNPKHRSRGTTSLFDLDSISAEAAGVLTRVTTDKDGKFKITGVGKDRSVRITVRGEMTEHFQVRVVTRAIDPKLEQHGPFGLHGAKFTLRIGPSRPIVGTVRDAKTGAGVSGMKVVELIGNLCETTVDKDGKFKLVGVPKAARYMIATGSLGEAPYFGTGSTFDDTQGLEAVTADLKVYRGTVATGRVTDAAGRPVAGHVFYDWTRDNPHAKEYQLNEWQSYVGTWGHLDRDGRYKLLVIPGPGALGVCASPEDAYPRLDTKKELIALGVWSWPTDAIHAVTGVDIDTKNPKTLAHAFTLTAGTGRTLVIGGADGPRPEKLRAVGQTETRQPAPITSDTLELKNLSLTRARAVVLMDDAKTVGAVATVTGGADTPVTVTLEKLGAASGRLCTADGSPAIGAEVRVRLLLGAAKYDNLPDEVFTKLGVSGIEPGAWQHFTGRTAKTDKDGKFTLTGLLPGQKYHLIAGFNFEKMGGELLHERTDVTVKPGATNDLGDLKPKK